MRRRGHCARSVRVRVMVEDQQKFRNFYNWWWSWVRGARMCWYVTRCPSVPTIDIGPYLIQTFHSSLNWQALQARELSSKSISLNRNWQLEKLFQGWRTSHWPCTWGMKACVKIHDRDQHLSSMLTMLLVFHNIFDSYVTSLFRARSLAFASKWPSIIGWRLTIVRLDKIKDRQKFHSSYLVVWQAQ